MPLLNILAAAQDGNYFANIAKACGIGVDEAKSSLEKLCPAIAVKLKSKAQSDHDAFERLLDLLEEGGDSSDLDDPEATSGSEAVADGNAVLEDIYGSRTNALAEMKKLGLGLDNGAAEKISALGATSVLAILAKTYAAPATLSSTPAATGQNGGILGTIISAVVKGVLQGVARQLAPNRRSYSSYFGTRRRTSTRRRKGTISLDDIFGQILGTRKN